MNKLKPKIIIGAVEGEMASRQDAQAVFLSVTLLVPQPQTNTLLADQAQTVIALTLEAAAEMLAALNRAQARLGFPDIGIAIEADVPPERGRH